MTIQRTFTQRVGFYTTCVAPAATTILSDQSLDCGEGETIPSLQAQISAEGLCYLYVKRIEHASYPEDGEEDLYLACVAASPEAITFDYATMLLTEAQLRYALPWDERLKKQDPTTIIKRLHAHAAALQPLVARTSEHTSVSTREPQVTLTPLDEPIQVNAEDVQDTLATLCEQGEDNAMNEYRTQQAFLVVAAHTLMCQLSSQGLFLTNDGAVMRNHQTPKVRTLHARCALVARVQRWHREHRQAVVKAAPLYGNGHVQTAWSLTIGVPVLAA